MKNTFLVPVPKTDVLMEDFSNIEELIDRVASDRQQLLDMRNCWEIFFLGYDDDPRELPVIPEVVHWIEQSIEVGIPWFYFMRAERDSSGLSTFLVCCGANRDPEHPGRYCLDADKTLAFIRKNLDNLEIFAEKYDIPDDIGCAATDDIMAIVQDILQGSMDEGNPPALIDRDKQIGEAIERLTLLEQLYDINPKIKKYFKNGEIYYSYITGGFLGSIDTIDYDQRYAEAVQDFEERTSCLVYHVVERGNTIALLFVSDDCDRWLDERPTVSGIMAQVVNVDTHETERGYIQIDVTNGALYRSNDTIYASLPGGVCPDGLSVLDAEVVERLELLKSAGLMSDLDIAQIYAQEGEICCSLLSPVLGTPVGVVNRVSARAAYARLLEAMQGKVPMKLYFLMGSVENKLAFLSVSEDEDDWEYEKLLLEKGRPFAMVIDLDDMTARFEQIKIEMVNGGPIFVD